MREVETVARGRAFGSQLTTARRRAIEDRAVKAATGHFETEGWFLDDVGLYEPYDLHSSKGRRNLHVEVKDSTCPLGSIARTAGEVEDARRHHPDTALFVRHSIKLDGSPTKPRAREGEVHLVPWMDYVGTWVSRRAG